MKNDKIHDAQSANGETRSAYKPLVGNRLGRDLRTHRTRRKDNIILHHEKIGCHYGSYNQLVSGSTDDIAQSSIPQKLPLPQLAEKNVPVSKRKLCTA
jgi:hypothetical protein